jgi:hemin uptake protein HemP
LKLPENDGRRSQGRAIRKLSRSGLSVTKTAAPVEPNFWNSEEVFRGHREVQIRHNGVAYRLRITSTGKLILTK